MSHLRTPTGKPDEAASPPAGQPGTELGPAEQPSLNGRRSPDGPPSATVSSTTQTSARTGSDSARASAATGFRSILFASHDAPTGLDELPAPECFPDLNLDQVVASVVAAKEPYRLLGYFHVPLDSPDAIIYRQQVFQDLELKPIYDIVARFADGMRTMRARIERVNKSHYHYQKQRWFLDAVRAYCETIETITSELDNASFESRGLTELANYLSQYRASPAFTALRDEADAVAHGLDSILYDVWVRGAKVTVGAFDEEPDYSADVAKTFERFQQRDIQVRPADRNARRNPFERGGTDAASNQFMDHVEAQILDQVAKVFPDHFAALDAFCHAHGDYLDRTIAVFDREIQFYIAYLDYLAPLRRAGLTLDYPQMSVDDKAENATDTFDLALAAQLLRDAENGENPVVRNDIHLEGNARILVISGPNNGGKTTMARTVGQLHYLAKLGCPVPGRDVRLYLVDEVFTHFEKEEDIATLAGKLQEELGRMHDDFQRATPRSLMIMNEMFSSTTVHDALFLSKEMLGRLSDLDALGVCVTFLDELATLNGKTVSMVSTVDPKDLARRTFKVIRTPADGKAYAQALAEKYGLTYEMLKGRVSS